MMVFQEVQQLERMVLRYHQMNPSVNVKENTLFLHRCISTLNELTDFSHFDDSVDQWLRKKTKQNSKDIRSSVAIAKLSMMLRKSHFVQVAPFRLFRKWNIFSKNSKIIAIQKYLKLLRHKKKRQCMIIANRTQRRLKFGEAFLRWKFRIIYLSVQQFRKTCKFGLMKQERMAQLKIFKLILKKAIRKLSIPRLFYRDYQASYF